MSRRFYFCFGYLVVFYVTVTYLPVVTKPDRHVLSGKPLYYSKIDKICAYLRKLSTAADSFYNTIDHLNKVYTRHLQIIDVLVNVSGKTDYNLYTDTEKLMLENTVYLVGMLYKCCQTKLVLQSDRENDTNSVNFSEIYGVGTEANKLLKKINGNSADDPDGEYYYVCNNCGANFDDEDDGYCPFCESSSFSKMKK